jgi:hypothetical protein
MGELVVDSWNLSVEGLMDERIEGRRQILVSNLLTRLKVPA